LSDLKISVEILWH